jgi:hypothetical protein
MKITSNLSPLASSREGAPRVTRQARTDASRFERLRQAADPPPKPAVSSQPVPAQSTAQPVANPLVSTTNVFSLVTPKAPAAASAVASDPPAVPAEEHPTAESVFGSNPWMTAPGGSSVLGGSYGYNSMYFATRETADKVAQLLGGTVVAMNWMTGAPGSPFIQAQPNYMVQLPNGHVINAGLTASYYTHGWSQSFINHMLELDRSA